MEDFEKQEGLSFLIIHYTARDVLYYLNFAQMKKFWDRAKEGGRKSFRFEELDMDYVLHPAHGIFVPYLDGINVELEKRG